LKRLNVEYWNVEHIVIVIVVQVSYVVRLAELNKSSCEFLLEC